MDESNLSNMVVNQYNKHSDFMLLCSASSGNAHLLEQRSCKLVTSFKMNGTCASGCFSADDRFVFTAGDQAEIYQWDLRMNTCLNKTQDEGNFSTTCIGMSKDMRHLATGSKMGTLNLFNMNREAQMLDSKPSKQIMNLTTSITDLKFDPSSQLVSFCSKWKKNAVRMAHLQSQTVY